MKKDTFHPIVQTVLNHSFTPLLYFKVLDRVDNSSYCRLCECTFSLPEVTTLLTVCYVNVQICLVLIQEIIPISERTSVPTNSEEYCHLFKSATIMVFHLDFI